MEETITKSDEILKIAS